MKITCITTDNPARDLSDWKSRERAMKEDMELSKSRMFRLPLTKKGREARVR